MGLVSPRRCGALAGHAGPRRNSGGHGRWSGSRGLVRHGRWARPVPQHAEDHRVLSAGHARPGGTRKIVAVAGSVEYMALNLPALIGSMHARLGLSRSGSSAQSVASLVQLGRRLSAVNFVAFVLAAADVLKRHVVPLALLAQKNDVGAFSVWRRTASCQASIGEALAMLSVIEDWWSVTALVGCMVSVADMARLWTALLISPLGRSFPRLVGATHHALWKQTYHGCSLHVDQAAARLDTGSMTLSPRCQCASMRTPRRNGPRRALITLRGRRGPVTALVPEWVAHSCLGAGFGIAGVREGRARGTFSHASCAGPRVPRRHNYGASGVSAEPPRRAAARSWPFCRTGCRRSGKLRAVAPLSSSPCAMRSRSFVARGARAIICWLWGETLPWR